MDERLLQVQETVDGAGSHDDVLTLPFELRAKSRLRARLDGGREVALQMPRGRVLRGGERLRAEDGTVILVRAAVERVSVAVADDATTLTRGAYHLGNRHVPVQVGDGWLRYAHDHVLDDMLRGQGLDVRVQDAPFEPEGGAYGAHGHGGDHAHGHGHGH